MSTWLASSVSATDLPIIAGTTSPDGQMLGWGRTVMVLADFFLKKNMDAIPDGDVRGGDPAGCNSWRA